MIFSVNKQVSLIPRAKKVNHQGNNIINNNNNNNNNTSEGAKENADGFISSMTLILRSMGKTNTNSTSEILKSSSFMIQEYAHQAK